MRIAAGPVIRAVALAMLFAAAAPGAHAEKAKKSGSKSSAKTSKTAKAPADSVAKTEGATSATKNATDAPKPGAGKTDAAESAASPTGIADAKAGHEGAGAAEPAPGAAAAAKVSKWSNGPVSSGAVALTFDDGPHATLTPQLIETLKAAKVTATFFMLGSQVDLNPGIAKMVADAGFEIGNHSYSHRDMRKLTTDQIREELQKTQDAIEKATGRRPKIFRPPYGNLNSKVTDLCAEMGLEIVTWSIDPRDWDQKVSTANVKGKILKDAAGGQIVCIHDIHKRTVNLVPELIKGIQEKKLTLTTAGDLIEQARKAMAEGKFSGGGGEAVADEAPAAPATIPLNKTKFKKVIY